jgi:hypothetical protein
MSGTIDLSPPERVGRGRVSSERRAEYDASVEAWCQRLLEIKPRLDFDPGARGWCYILEEHGLSKGDFDDCEKLITACRKNGRLPLDFCGDDDAARDFIHVEDLNDPDPETHARGIVSAINRAHLSYEPVSFWDYQQHFVQLLVEKIGLKNLFSRVCDQYHVPLGNSRGSPSIWQRIRILERFAERQAKGNRCVLLYFGDHDIHGLRISRSLRANFEEVLGAFNRYFPEYEGFDLDEVVIERFGLNADFIERHKLSWTEGLITGSGKDLGDPSHRKYGEHDVQDYIRRFGERKVEADALVTRAEASRAPCKTAILGFIDQDGIDQYEQERLDRQVEMQIALDRRLVRISE